MIHCNQVLHCNYFEILCRKLIYAQLSRIVSNKIYTLFHLASFFVKKSPNWKVSVFSAPATIYAKQIDSYRVIDFKWCFLQTIQLAILPLFCSYWWNERPCHVTWSCWRLGGNLSLSSLALMFLSQSLTLFHLSERSICVFLLLHFFFISWS